MKFQLQHGHILVMRQAYEFECACLAKESSLHNLHSMGLSISCRWIR